MSLYLRYFQQTCRNNSSRCFLRRLPDSKIRTHLPTAPGQTAYLSFGPPSKYYPGPTLLDFGDRIGTPVCPTWPKDVLFFNKVMMKIAIDFSFERPFLYAHKLKHEMRVVK
jgi:hypothetical protein